MTFDELEESWKKELPPGVHASPSELKQLAVAAATKSEFKASVFEYWAIVVFGSLGLATLVDALRQAAAWHSYLAPILMLAIAGYVYSIRVLRRRQIDFSGSIADIVNRHLCALDAHIDRVKSFRWWFLLPTCCAAVASFLIDEGANRPFWIPAILPLGAAAVWLSMMMEIKASHVPHRRMLRSLQQQLERETQAST